MIKNKLIKDIRVLNIFLVVLCFITIFISLGIGFYGIGLKQIILSLFGKSTVTNGVVILNIRFPRIIGGFLVGAALSVSGATYQGVLKNPLVSPSILGVSTGAGLGAAIAIMLRLGSVYIQFFALCFGIVAALLTYFISNGVKFDRRVSLILSGQLVATMCFSVISLFTYVADTSDQLPELSFWLLGSLAKVDNSTLIFAIPFMLVGFIIIYLMRWKLNILTLSDVEASSLGIDTKKSMIVVILGSTLLCSSAVCIGGLIAWVGLMIPHIARGLFGAQFSKMLPACGLIGGIFMVLIDDVARTITVFELPIGVLVSLIGAPFFYMLLRKGKEA